MVGTMVHTSNLDEHVRESLRHKIITGEMAGGYHLSELKISKDFRVSRTPVREALCSLYADDLIEMIPHRGAFVKDIAAEIRIDRYRTYGLLMAMAARQTAEDGQIELLMELDSAVQGLQPACIETETFAHAVTQVQSIMRRATGSPTLQDALTMVERRTHTDLVWHNAYPQKDIVLDGLLAAGQAIKQHHADKAEQHMRRVMDALCAPIITAIRQEDATFQNS